MRCWSPLELPRRDGDAEDRARARRGLRRRHQARLRDAAHHARAHAASGGGGGAQGPRQRAAVAQDGALVGHMLKDPRVRVISFTGSTEVGRKLLHAAADNVLKPAMELGGNAPCIVFEDADMDTAINGTMLAKMRNLGEACTAANRIYVHEDVAEEFTRRLAARMSALKVGDGTDPTVDVGPLVNAETRDKVAAFVADAVAKGARIECGGQVPDRKGYFYPPTVLSNVPATADCIRDEIFGPVAAIQTFRDEEDVIARANDTEYGLVAYVFSENMKRALKVCERLDYGMVGLNRGLVSDPAAPFGGTKQSGLGREGGRRGNARVHGDPVHLGGVVRTWPT